MIAVPPNQALPQTAGEPAKPDRPGHSIPAGVLVLVTSGLAIAAAVNLVQEWRRPEYAMPWWVIVIGVICAVCTVAGGVIAARRHAISAWLVAIAAFLLVAGLLTFYIIVTLPVVLLGYLIARVVGMRRGKGPRSRLGATLLSIGITSLLLLTWLGGPIATCTNGGGGSSTPIWLGLGGSGSSGGGGGSFGPDGEGNATTTGYETYNGHTYTWTCNGDRLVDFATH